MNAATCSRATPAWFFLALVATACGESPARDPDTPPNTLTDEERSEGWMLLFDGETTDGWRGYNRDVFPSGAWEVRDGNLVVLAAGERDEGQAGDLVTVESFGDFELRLDVRLSPMANSGIFYRVLERDGSPIWHHAPEFQVLDDSAYVALGTMDMRTHLTGDNYDLHESAVRAARPVGEWNHARIVVNGGHVEHWLNGSMTVAYELGSPEWEALVAASKFAGYPDYGRAPAGPIGLQDHDHRVAYRNVKLRRLP